MIDRIESGESPEDVMSDTDSPADDFDDDF